MKENKNPEFVIHCGPMFSSKTSHLFSDIDRCERQNKSVYVFKPNIDDRYSTNCIVSHNGQKHDAILVKNGVDILTYIENNGLPNVIAIDEAFMIPGSADVAIWLFQRGTSLFVSSIELTYNGKPLKEITNMFVWATNIIKHSAVCSLCKCDTARYSYRKSSDNSDIVVGGDNIYEARCWSCHPLINKKEEEENE